MREFDIVRRSLLKLLGGCAAAGVTGCRGTETPRDGLVRLLDLSGGESGWLNVLSDQEQRELYELLSGGQPEGRAPAVRLLQKVLAPRSRLFAFVGYPAVRDERSVCDGLLRE